MGKSSGSKWLVILLLFMVISSVLGGFFLLGLFVLGGADLPESGNVAKITIDGVITSSGNGY